MHKRVRKTEKGQNYVIMSIFGIENNKCRVYEQEWSVIKQVQCRTQRRTAQALFTLCSSVYY